MMSTPAVPYGGRVAGSALGIARESDEGALRALCQVCSTTGTAETRKNEKCVLVTIYRRESDLFALLLRERHSNGLSVSEGGAGGHAEGRGKGAGVSGVTVLCDMALDDGVHLERPPHGDSLVVKVVNTCRRKNAYLLEFGREVDLDTFQRAFTAARGYFRQMLTLRSLVADSFWQGFASGGGGPVRNEPYAPPSDALKPPPGVVPGASEAGLRGKTEGPGARGLDAESLAAKVFGLWPAAEGTEGGASCPRARSPGTKSSASFSRGFRAGSGSGSGGGDDSGVGSWAGAGSWGAAVEAAARAGGDRKANAEFNLSCVDQRGRNCHKCQHNVTDRAGMRFECPNGRASHVFCAKCLERAFCVEGAKTLLLDGTLRYVCPVCEGFCSCRKCETKPRGGRSRKQANGGGAADHDDGVDDMVPSNPGTLVQNLPAPQLSHYEGLFAKYLQSLPALERVSTTEDVCFLCKEGGNLVECDKGTSWYRRVERKREALGKPPVLPGTAFSSCGVPMEEEGGGGDANGGAATKQGGEENALPPPRCKKVYHAYCMGFNVADDELSSCPRHACVECAEAADYFCRFCPVSLCDEHYRTDPSGIVAETYESLQHRVRRPFPRTRGGGFRRPSTPAPPAVGSRGGGRIRGRGTSGGGGGRIRGRGTSGGGGGSGVLAGENIAHNRPKRGRAQASASTPAPAASRKGGRRDRSRGAGVGGGGRGGGGGGSGNGGKVRDKRSSGVGEAGGAGFGENDFVCTGCKMAARRAVRQYGLMGSLETGGVVLPYGESEESGDENEWDVKPVTTLAARGAAASSSPPSSPAFGGGIEPGVANGSSGDNVEDGEEQEKEKAREAGVPGDGGSGSGGRIGSPNGKKRTGAGGADGTDGGDGVAGVPDGDATAAPAAATENEAAAALAADECFSMFSPRQDGTEGQQGGGSAAEDGGVTGGVAGGGCVKGGDDGSAEAGGGGGGGGVEDGGSDVEME